MATQEITVTKQISTYRYVTATLRNTYTTSLTNDKLTISGTLSLVGDGVIDVGDELYADLSNATLSVFGSQLVSVSSKTISGYAGGEQGISRHVTVEQTLGTYTKVISRTHSAQSVVVSMAAQTLAARNDYGASATVVSQTRSTAISLAAKPSYTISYNANGGSSTPASQTKWYNEALTLASAITRDKYLFGGWKWNNTGTAVAAGSSWNSANATGTFYAAWDYKYQKPSITRVTAWRTGTTASGGVYPKQDDGTNADIQVVLTAGKEKATAGGAYSVANTTVKFYYKLTTASTYTLISTQTLSSATGTLTAHISSTLDTEKQYDVKVEAYITASATQSTSFTTFISTSFSLVDMTQDGVAFGRSAESNKFLCNLPMTIYNSLNVSPPSGVSAYNINGVALSAADVQAPKLTHTNELNVYGGAQNGNFWINYRNADTDAQESTAQNTIYCFGNYKAGVKGTTIKAGALVLNEHSSAIGSMINGYVSTATALPSGTATALCSVTVPAGTWLLNGCVRFPSTGAVTGVRRINISQTSGATDLMQQVAPVQSDYTQIEYVTVLSVTASTTFYLNAYQTSGSSLTIPAAGVGWGTHIRATRLV